MDFRKTQMQINGLSIDVVRKDVKYLRLAVYPPFGQVRVSAPLSASAEAIYRAVNTKLDWIRRQQAKIAVRPRQTPTAMVTGEQHYFMGQSYRLRVIEQHGARKVLIQNQSCIELTVHPADTPEQRRELLFKWYRQQLRTLIPPLIAKWEPILGVQVAEWGIKRMKTRWGSCNITAGRVWLNLELVKKPEKCLEYIVVHEMLHLIERYHNAHFKELLDENLPQWRKWEGELKSIELS